MGYNRAFGKMTDVLHAQRRRMLNTTNSAVR